MTRLATAALLLAAVALGGCGVDRPNAPTRLPRAAAAQAAKLAPAGRKPTTGAPDPTTIWSFIDLDHDGELSFAEAMQAPFGQPVAGWQPGEQEAQVRQALARMDRNQDGVVTRAEFLAAWSGQSGAAVPVGR